MLFQEGDWTSEEFPCEILYLLEGGHLAELYVAKLKNTKHFMVVKAAEKQQIQELVMREAKILSKLRYQGIPEIFGSFEDKNGSYFIMPYYQGMNLKQYIEQYGSMSEKLVKKIVMQICQILSYLHSNRISVVHEDLKPENLLLQEDGQVILLDLGLSELIHEEKEDFFGKKIVFCGTLGYAAPECWHRETMKISPTTDIFALGSTIFYLLEGKEPKDYYGKLVLSGNKQEKWQKLIDKCCALDITKRYQSTIDVYQELHHIQIE